MIVQQSLPLNIPSGDAASKGCLFEINQPHLFILVILISAIFLILSSQLGFLFTAGEWEVLGPIIICPNDPSWVFHGLTS